MGSDEKVVQVVCSLTGSTSLQKYGRDGLAGSWMAGVPKIDSLYGTNQ